MLEEEKAVSGIEESKKHFLDPGRLGSITASVIDRFDASVARSARNRALTEQFLIDPFLKNRSDQRVKRRKATQEQTEKILHTRESGGRRGCFAA